jgi:hypothetical protein
METREWEEKEIIFLKDNYPSKGKEYCSLKLNRTLASIRAKASRLRLSFDQNSEFSKDFHKRAGLRRRGDKNCFFGKKHSQETISIIIEKNKNIFKDHQRRADTGARTKKWIEANGHPKGMLGKKHTQESIDKMTATKLKKYGTLNMQKEDTTKKMLETRMKKYGRLDFLGSNTYSRCKSGWKTIGGNKCFFRSGWESNYACYLEWLRMKKEIKSWRHESKTFWFENIRRGVRSYLPDFEITNNDGGVEYHEVKGYMDNRSKTKIKRMAKYYPETKLIVICKKEYTAIKKWSRLIDGWE